MATQTSSAPDRRTRRLEARIREAAALWTLYSKMAEGPGAPSFATSARDFHREEWYAAREELFYTARDSAREPGE